MTYCVNIATPIYFIDSKCHIKQFKAGKSHATCLTNHTRPISYRIMPLVINALKGGHTDTHRQTDRQTHTDRQTDRQTDTHTNTQTKAISRNQACKAEGIARLV